jgi:hypothetical protein
VLCKVFFFLFGFEVGREFLERRKREEFLRRNRSIFFDNNTLLNDRSNILFTDTAGRMVCASVLSDRSPVIDLGTSLAPLFNTNSYRCATYMVNQRIGANIIVRRQLRQRKTWLLGRWCRLWCHSDPDSPTLFSCDKCGWCKVSK